jgi:diamine N-acetyltransferase
MSTKLVVVNEAETADADALHRLAVKTFLDTFGDTAAPEDIATYVNTDLAPDRILAELNEPDGKYWVAKVDGESAGFARLLWRHVPECVTGPRPIELLRLYVDRPFLGQGIAQQLMDTTIAWAQRHGYQTMFLGVWEHNHRAQRFYAKYGFEKVGEHVFPVGSDPQIDWYLSREL